MMLMTDDQQTRRAQEAVRYGPRRGDAFGAALMACWQRGGAVDIAYEFIEREDGFIDAMDAARYFGGPEQWGPLDRWVYEQARGRILDVGSGAGRHSLALQERGADVVALDISPLAAEVCRRRGIKQVVTGTVA